ncbi:MAG: ATP-binding protein [Bacteroidaceae bacterium]|nr:ATP-binding protein [Bacteroidaceae bacterium]
MAYFRRHIDEQLLRWKDDPRHKPLLIRGARQVGKSTAVRELARQFRYFVEINLEKQPDLLPLFPANIDVKKTCEKLSGTLGIPIVPGQTLLFIDEIQVSKEAVMSLRYFKEDYPELHVVAAGSLLEFTLEELPSFGVGRIRSLYMYPFSFDEFLMAQGLDLTIAYKKKATSEEPLTEKAHKDLIDQLRTFYLVGGMPAAVTEWMETYSYISVSHVHTDIIQTYEDDFSKYKKRVSPVLLRQVLRSVALQVGKKFVYTEAARDIHSSVIRDALHLLTQAGLITPVRHTDGNGVPLGAEEDASYTKYLFFDLGVMQTMLDIPAADILMASDVDFVNKGGTSEMFAGLEMMKYHDCFQRAEMHYWQNSAKGSNAEVDYLRVRSGRVLPVEVKANTQGGMQSLWIFMRMRQLHQALRTSLENFGQFDYYDPKDNFEQRHVDIIPLYALSNI